MRHFLPLASALLLVLASLPAPRVQAQEAQFTTTVPVVDTSEIQRDHAFTVALAQVMTRAAGRDLSSQPGYADILGSAPSYVQQYQYARAPAGVGQPFVLKVQFDAAAVRRLLGHSGVTVWSGPDAPVLLLVRDDQGQALAAAQLSALGGAVRERGIEVLYADAGLDPAAIAALDDDALAAVAQRYHTGLILMGDIAGAGGEWTLVAGGQPQQWQDQAADTDALLAQAGEKLVQRLSERFRVQGGGGGNATLWVTGIDSAEDFAQLLHVLRADAAVRSAVPAAAMDNGVLLQLATSAPLARVIDGLAAGGYLLAARESRGEADASLQWLR